MSYTSCIIADFGEPLTATSIGSPLPPAPPPCAPERDTSGLSCSLFGDELG